jgi:hypothetical protein
MDMARAGWWLIPVLFVALLIGGAVGAFVAHDRHDDRTIQITTPGSQQTGDAPQVVQIDDDRGRHWFGFFPFFLLFPLLWIGLIWLIFGGFWRHRGPGRGRWEDRFADWHRRQHETSDRGPAGPSAAGTA